MSNVLQELGNFAEAKKEFLLAIDSNENQPEIWKNLGTVYFHLQDHEAEIRCYDKALALNDTLPQALISKGTTLLNIFNRPSEAAELLEFAISVDETISIQWPHVWYWLAYAYFKQGELSEALIRAERGLSAVPHHSSLLDLKANLLARLWKIDPTYIDQAINFFQFKIELSQDDYDSIAQLSYLYLEIGQKDQVWKILGRFAEFEDNFDRYLEFSSHSIEDAIKSFRYFAAYKKYRTLSPLSDYSTPLTENKVVLLVFRQ